MMILMIVHFYTWKNEKIFKWQILQPDVRDVQKDSMRLKSNKRHLQMFQLKSIYKILRYFLQSWKQVEETERMVLV